MNQLVRERVSHSLTRFTLQCNIQVEVFRLTTSCMELALTFELFLQHPTPIGRPLFDLRFCSYHLLSPDYKIYITQLSYKLKEYPTSSELCAQLTCTKGSSACFPYDINLQSAKEKMFYIVLQKLLIIYIMGCITQWQVMILIIFTKIN